MKNDSKKYHYNLTCSNTNYIKFKPEVRFFVLLQNSVYFVVLSFLFLFSPAPVFSDAFQCEQKVHKQTKCKWLLSI